MSLSSRVPAITESRQQKLFETIQKRFKTHAGIDIAVEGMHIPYGDNGESKGYIFVEMGFREDAAQAIRQMDGYAFDKKHRFSVHRFTDVEKFASLSEQYVEPEEEEFKAREHLRSWLADPSGRDQLVICRGDDVEIAWHNRSRILRSSTAVPVGQRATFSGLLSEPSSPPSTDKVSRSGVVPPASASCVSLIRCPSRRLLSSEKFMVTWSHDPIQVPDNAPIGPQFFGPKMRATASQSGGPNRSPLAILPCASGRERTTWPAQGLLLAFPQVEPRRQVTAHVSTQARPSASTRLHPWVCSRRSRSRSKGWSTLNGAPWATRIASCRVGQAQQEGQDNMIVFWQPEVANQPARVTVMAVPSRTILRSKNLFNVSDCKLHWHHRATTSASRSTDTQRPRSPCSATSDLPRARKGVPCRGRRAQGPVTAFAWEPHGTHFAVISSNGPQLGTPAPVSPSRPSSTSTTSTPRATSAPSRVLDNKTLNTLFWSPRGRHMVAATLGSSQKFDLEWYDVDFMHEVRQGNPSADPADDVKLIGTGEHYGITDLEWDPSGRYVATSASVWRHSLENGFAIWDFKGQELQKHIQDRFKQILWRPRPRSLLSKEDKYKVRKNLREYSKQFEEEDAAEESNLASAERELYQRILEEWKAWRGRARRDLEQLREDLGREEVGQSVDHAKKLQEEATEEVQEWMEEIIEETEEVLA